MVRIRIAILLLMISVLCGAQIDSTNLLHRNGTSLNISYNTSVIYPGFCSGIEFPVKPGKYKKLINKTIITDRLIEGNINFYHHPYFHDNLYLTASWIMRRTNSKGLISEFSVGPGLSRTFIGGTTYEVLENSEVSIKRMSGYYYALLSLGGGFGYDFSIKKQLPVSVFTNFKLISMFPYNSIVYIRPVLGIGLRYRCSG